MPLLREWAVAAPLRVRRGTVAGYFECPECHSEEQRSCDVRISSADRDCHASLRSARNDSLQHLRHVTPREKRSFDRGSLCARQDNENSLPQPDSHVGRKRPPQNDNAGIRFSRRVFQTLLRMTYHNRAATGRDTEKRRYAVAYRRCKTRTGRFIDSASDRQWLSVQWAPCRRRLPSSLPR